MPKLTELDSFETRQVTRDALYWAQFIWPALPRAAKIAWIRGVRTKNA